MTLRIVTEPAIEPVTVAEFMAWSRIDSSSQEPAPSAITAALASPAAPGNVNDGSHRYLATFVTATGETHAGVISAAVTVSDKDVNGQVSLTAIPVGGSLVTARKIYRTAANGTDFKLLATIANNTGTTYTDNVADADLGAGAPTANTTSDPVLNMLITSARREAEKLTGRALITQTWELLLDKFPEREIRIGMLPIQSITSVKYYDSDGALQTLGSENYTLDADAMPGWILPAYGVSWPQTYSMANAVVIRFVAGYGSAAGSVPHEFRAWISAQAASAYNSPDGNVHSNSQRLQFIDGLLDAYRIRLFA